MRKKKAVVVFFFFFLASIRRPKNQQQNRLRTSFLAKALSPSAFSLECVSAPCGMSVRDKREY